MKNFIVNTVAALGLFAGSLVGMLAVTGRLDHEGTRGIPLIADLFPAPEGDAEGPGGLPENASPRQGEPQDPKPPPVLRQGRSVFEPEPAPDQAGGEPATNDGTGQTEQGVAAAGGKQEPGAQGESAASPPRQESGPGPGGYFRFEGMPAGLSADKIDEYWRRAREARAELDRRESALDLREEELRALEQDIARRQTELANQRTRLEEMQRDLEARLQEFQRQVKLVRSDEVAGLKRNAQTLASFEPSKAAELLQEQWKSDAGQELVLKTLEVMERDAANEIISELPDGLIRDVLEKRLRVSRERSEEDR